MEGVIKMARKRKFTMDPVVYYDEGINNKSISPAVEETRRVPDTRKGIVGNAPFVRLRKRPNTDASTIKILEKGDEVTILGKTVEGYYMIDLGDDRIGYISCKYCEEVT